MMDIASISNGLYQADDGIWYSTEDEDISYPVDGNDTCFSLEDSSFWFRHRNACIESVISAFPPENNGAIFDVGGGNGYVSHGLSQAGFDTVLVEPGKAGASNAIQRGVKTVICATTDTAQFRPNSLPAVGLFDVIEHIEKDIELLESIMHLVKKGGVLYATVPAYKELWSNEDVQAGHYRRYSLQEITRVIKSAGFNVEFSSYIFRILPLPTFFMRALPYRLGKLPKKMDSRNVSKDHVVKHGAVSKALDLALRGEINNLGKGIAMRFGGSCLIVASRP
jgi:2-polyprenyl-3-methyl-5-hydroxy-6-metoxy-1,4-benzoquinol methylase